MAKWNKSETLLLLTLYEQYPFLYKNTDQNFLNKRLRKQTLEEICKELKKVKTDVSVEEIKMKIKTLRSQLQKEKRLIEYSKKIESLSNEEYVPTLWSYRHIKFLDDSLEDEPPDASNTESSEAITTEYITCEELDYVQDGSEGSFKSTLEVPPKRKRTDSFREEARNSFEFAKSYAEQILQNRAKRKPETKEDIFAKYLCEQLKLIQSEDNYEDTTWKILQVVRESIRKDRLEREKPDLSDNLSLASDSRLTPDYETENKQVVRGHSLKKKGMFERIL